MIVVYFLTGIAIGLLIIQYMALANNIHLFATKKEFKKSAIPFYMYYESAVQLIKEYRSLK